MTMRFAYPSRGDPRSRDYRRSSGSGHRPIGILELIVVFEGGIVIFPTRPGTAPSSRESNSSELRTLITLSTLFPPCRCGWHRRRNPRPGGDIAAGGGGVPAGHDLSSGGGTEWRRVDYRSPIFAPAQANVPLVDLLPPDRR